MSTRDDTHTAAEDAPVGQRERRRLLDGVPVTEEHHTLAGVPTAVLTGGSGHPIVLLHGPGESAVNWRWVIPDLVEDHRVVAPDLPAHGSSDTGDTPLDPAGVVAWLGELLERTCETPPTLVGHVLGGAIAARYAVDHSDRLRRLVLVDSLGLGRFRPSPAFALRFLGFQARPNEATYERFMRQCAFDLDTLRDDMGDDWDAFEAYNLALARSPKAKAAGRLFRAAGVPRIPAGDLDRIEAPTTLVWGRHDKALRLKIAERASSRHGWPLHVIDDSADDPPRDQPAAFLDALRAAMDPT